MPSTHQQQAKAAIGLILAVSETIRELGSVPSGHLYGHLCGKVTLEVYRKIIATLKNAGLVKEDGLSVITWIGPKFEGGR